MSIILLNSPIISQFNSGIINLGKKKDSIDVLLYSYLEGEQIFLNQKDYIVALKLNINNIDLTEEEKKALYIEIFTTKYQTIILNNKNNYSTIFPPNQTIINIKFYLNNKCIESHYNEENYYFKPVEFKPDCLVVNNYPIIYTGEYPYPCEFTVGADTYFTLSESSTVFSQLLHKTEYGNTYFGAFQYQGRENSPGLYFNAQYSIDAYTYCSWSNDDGELFKEDINIEDIVSYTSHYLLNKANSNTKRSFDCSNPYSLPQYVDITNCVYIDYYWYDEKEGINIYFYTHPNDRQYSVIEKKYE